MFTLPDLPYDIKALEPYISAQTLSFHHGKHHQTYVDNLNKLVAGTSHEDMPLENLILKAAHDSTMAAIFNNAAQVWNHTFYWHCLRPASDALSGPTGELKDRIDHAFGNVETFLDEFHKAALSQFGSGWAWLVIDQGDLKITKTSNADLPMAYGQRALMTCDVWEHAYYLDYQNRRADYVKTILDKLTNWDFVSKNLIQSHN